MLNFKAVHFGYLNEIISDHLKRVHHKNITTRFLPEPKGYFNLTKSMSD